MILEIMAEIHRFAQSYRLQRLQSLKEDNNQPVGTDCWKHLR